VRGGDVIVVVVEGSDNAFTEIPPELVGGHSEGSCGAHCVQDFSSIELTEKLFDKCVVFYHDGFQ
jgi:hypothetical protein